MQLWLCVLARHNIHKPLDILLVCLSRNCQDNKGKGEVFHLTVTGCLLNAYIDSLCISILETQMEYVKIAIQWSRSSFLYFTFRQVNMTGMRNAQLILHNWKLELAEFVKDFLISKTSKFHKLIVLLHFLFKYCWPYKTTYRK